MRRRNFAECDMSMVDELAVEFAANGTPMRLNADERVALVKLLGGRCTSTELIDLELRPWDGHPQVYKVQAYFRLRIENGNLALAIKLKPTRNIVRQAWADVVDQVTAHTQKPVYAQP